jgi:hypothetical protein
MDNKILVIIKKILIDLITAAIFTTVLCLLRTIKVFQGSGFFKLINWATNNIVAVFCFMAFIILGVMLIIQVIRNPCGIDMATGKKHFRSRCDLGGKPFIYKIPLKRSNEQIKINWVTFVEGMHKLKTVLLRAGIAPQIIFGANEAGIIIASYLSYFFNRNLVGIIKTGPVINGARNILQFDCPKLDFRENKVIDILLVDSELKSGKTAVEYQQKIIAHYRNEGFEPRIIYVALGGVLKEEDIFKKEILDSNDFGYGIPNGSDFKPAFVAFYFNQSGFDAPEGLR